MMFYYITMKHTAFPGTQIQLDCETEELRRNHLKYAPSNHYYCPGFALIREHRELLSFFYS